MIETTGVKSVIELAYDLTHADGTCVLVGVPSEKVTIYTLPIHFNKVLTGSHGGDAVPHVDIPRLIRLDAGRPAVVRRPHHPRVPARSRSTRRSTWCAAATPAAC